MGGQFKAISTPPGATGSRSSSTSRNAPKSPLWYVKGNLLVPIDQATDEVSSSPVRKCLHLPVSQTDPSVGVVTPTLPSLPFYRESQSQIDSHTNGSLVQRNNPHCSTRAISKKLHGRKLFTQHPATIADRFHCNVDQVTIDMLPDDALLEVFDFLLNQNKDVEAWHPLVHVCQRWRNIVFASPRRLNLHLHCTTRKPVREKLHVWPDFPIIMEQFDSPTLGVDSILATLGHKDRVCEIAFKHISSSLWENAFVAMEETLPALTRVDLVSEDETMPVVPDSFLGGSAPRLRSLYMTRIPFPGLPKLLSYASDLVDLELYDIPQSGYISPDTMVACLSTLTSLESLRLEFQFPRHIHERGWPPLQARSVLPALTYFSFRGVSEYLEDLVALIDTPSLDEFYITFFHQLILDTPQLAHFISRTPNLGVLDEAEITFLDGAIQVLLGSMQQISIRTTCKAPDWQLSFVAEVCRSFVPLIPSLEDLYICEGIYSRSRWQDDNVENDQWLELLGLFTTVTNLYLCKGVVSPIALALQELVGGQSPTEVLPALQGLFLEEPCPLRLVEDPHLSGAVPENIEKFVALRRLSGHPIAVSHWDRK